jgi:four helix bundle protein
VEGFEDLAVYRRAGALSDDLRAAVSTWPALDQWTVGVQMIRSADSIGANIAEATGRFGVPDQRRVLFIARGSASELQHWLERAAARDLTVPKHATGESQEIARMLAGLIRHIPSH